MGERLPARLKARLLGHFEITMDDEPLDPAHWGQRKTSTLLKYFLTHRGEVLTTDRLIEDLYPESDPSKVLRNLQGRISELRKGLEPDLQKGTDSRYLKRVAKGSYRFADSDCCWVDIEVFEQQAERCQRLISNEEWSGAVQLAREMLELYRGEFLAEDLYQEWTLSPRERIRELYLNILSNTAECHAHLGQFEDAIECIQKLIAFEPALESAYRQLMRYHAYLGDENRAVDCFESCQRALRSHLDVEPSAETLKLIEQIEAGEIETPQRAIPHNLQSPLTSFVGRQQELQDLKELLESTRLLTLTGVGGSGKTRLATEVSRGLLAELANGIRDGIRDGIWFVDLSAVTEKKQLARATAVVLGIREQGSGSLTEMLIGYLKTKHSLIILDNCEQIIEPVARFAEEILHACPNLKVLTTSRQAMGIAGEVVFDVPPMALPDESGDVDKLLGADAIRLFEARARSSQPGYAIGDQDAQNVFDICRAVDAIPLAIELAAARMKVLSPAQIAERMRDRFGLLSRGSRTADPRQQTLWAMIDWSFNLLDERGQLLLPRLSIFRGGFTVEAVEAICTGDGIDKNEMLDLLTDLVEKSLVIVAERNVDVVRYGLLETVRHYGETRLREAGELELWKQSHLGYFEMLAEELKPDLLGPNQKMAMRRLNEERANLQAAIQWTLKTSELSRTSGLRLVTALGKYWEMEGLWSEGRAQLEDVLRQSGGGGVPEVRAKALIWAGFLAYRQGNYDIAQSHLEESAELSQSAGDVQCESWAFSNLGSVAWAKGEVDAAKRYYGEGLKLAKEIEDLFGTAMALHNLALVHHESGDLQTAHKLYEESLVLKREIGDPANVALTLNNLGNIAYLRGDIERAKAHHEECLEIRREVGDHGTISTSLVNLGNVHFHMEEYDAARRYYEESLESKRKIGEQAGIALLLNNLGSVSRSEGDLESARRQFEEALSLRRELGDMRGVAASLNNLGATESMLQNYDRALELLRESIQLRHQLEDYQMLAGSFINITSCLVATEQYVDAAQCLGCAQEILQTTDGEMEPESARSFARDANAIKEALGDERFAELFAEGRSRPIEVMIELVMA